MKKSDFLIDLEKQATLSVEKVREEKFSKNLPFMLGELDLQGGDFYYEFSNGEIAICTFPFGQRQYQIIRYLSFQEADTLREKYNLLPCLIFT